MGERKCEDLIIEFGLGENPLWVLIACHGFFRLLHHSLENKFVRIFFRGYELPDGAVPGIFCARGEFLAFCDKYFAVKMPRTSVKPFHFTDIAGFSSHRTLLNYEFYHNLPIYLPYLSEKILMGITLFFNLKDAISYNRRLNNERK